MSIYWSEDEILKKNLMGKWINGTKCDKFKSKRKEIELLWKEIDTQTSWYLNDSKF